MTIMSVYNNNFLLNKRPCDELTRSTSNRPSLAKRFVRVLYYINCQCCHCQTCLSNYFSTAFNYVVFEKGYNTISHPSIITKVFTTYPLSFIPSVFNTSDAIII